MQTPAEYSKTCTQLRQSPSLVSVEFNTRRALSYTYIRGARHKTHARDVLVPTYIYTYVYSRTCTRERGLHEQRVQRGVGGGLTSA